MCVLSVERLFTCLSANDVGSNSASNCAEKLEDGSCVSSSNGGKLPRMNITRIIRIKSVLGELMLEKVC